MKSEIKVKCENGKYIFNCPNCGYGLQASPIFDAARQRNTYLQSLMKPKNQLIKRLTKLLNENGIDWTE
jgi:hypothetical protein